MKEIEVEAIVDNCNAQQYFDAIYATEAGMRDFHARVNKDPAASVEPWGADGVRVVRFVMPMNVPAMLKKFIGMDNVPVVETQRVEWLPDKSGFKMVSEPLLNFPGANKFTTSGFLEASTQRDGSCKVKAVMRCSAGMPWPVQASVEGLMATEAVDSIGTFLGFCKEYYASWRAEQLLQPERPAAAGPSATASANPGGDEFYDAVEDESELRRLPSTADAGEEASVVPYTPPRLEDVIVDCLRQIQASTAETASTLRSLEELIRNMDDNMQVLRDKLVGRRRQPAAAAAASRTAACPGTAAAAARTTPVAGAAAPCGSSSYLPSGALMLLASASLVCGIGAVAYMRSRSAVGAGGGGGGSS